MTAGTPFDVLGQGLIEDDELAVLSHGLLVRGGDEEDGGLICGTITLAPRVIGAVTIYPRVNGEVELGEC